MTATTGMMRGAAAEQPRRAVIYRMMTPQHICPSGLKALDLLRRYEISQLPVVRGNEVVGGINDVAVMQAVFDHADIMHKPVSEVMGRAFPALEHDVEVTVAYKLLTMANSAIVVTQDGNPLGVVTRQDIISFLSAQSA